MAYFNLIPMPKSIREAGGEVRVLPAVSTDAFSAAAETLCELGKKLFNLDISLGSGGIELFRESVLAPGAYRIECVNGAVCVFASDSEGAFYAVSTLLQLISVDGEDMVLPSLVIDDHPDCPFRALMIDVARKWHPFEHLLEYVDLCFFYKISFLHIHFTDNESYTLPSEVIPKACAKGRFYSPEQIARLNAYALSRGVEIIPETDLPGHCHAMIQSYPELFGHEGENLNDLCRYVICAGRDGVMDHVEAILSEVIRMFPRSRYIHVGGDEAPLAAWDACDLCQRYICENGLADSRALYTDFVRRVTDAVLSLGRTPIVWEGFPKEGSEMLSREIIVAEFESYYHLAPDLVEEGFNVINASWQPLYIVPGRHWTPEEIIGWNVFRWKNWVPSSFAYENPIDIQPTKQLSGAQLCAWECDYEESIAIVRENLAALSERTWNVCHGREDVNFRSRLDYIVPLAEKLK